MNRTTEITAILISGLVWLFACAPAPQAQTPKIPAPQSVAPVPSQAPPAPAKRYTMVCRNSQDGRKVACGTPGAVMVGIKEQ